MGYIHLVVSEICDPQNLDPICGKFDKFLAHGQAHIGQMGKWPWQCTTRGLAIPQNFEWRKSVKRLQRYGFRKSGSRPPGRPPTRTVTTIPLQPWGLRGKNVFQIGIVNWVVMTNHQMPLWKKSILWELIYWKTVATPQLSESRCVGPQNLEATLEVEPCLDSSGLYPGMSEGLGVSLKY